MIGVQDGAAYAAPTAPVRVGNTWRPNTTVTAIQVYRACFEIDVMCLACHAATGACSFQGQAEQSVCDCGMVHCGGCEPQVCLCMEYQHAAGGYWRQGFDAGPDGVATATPTPPVQLALPAPSGMPHYGCRCVPNVGRVCPAHGYALNQGDGECICPEASSVHTVECQMQYWDQWQNDLAIEAQEPLRCAGCPTPFYQLCPAACCGGVAKATPTTCFVCGAADDLWNAAITDTFAQCGQCGAPWVFGTRVQFGGVA